MGEGRYSFKILQVNLQEGPRGRGFDSRYFHNFKSGLGLERDSPGLLKIVVYLLDGEVEYLIKKN